MLARLRQGDPVLSGRGVIMSAYRFPVLVLAALSLPAPAYPIDLVIADISPTASNSPNVVVEMRIEPTSQASLAEFSKNAVGRQVEVRIDKQVVMSPVMTEAIVDGRLRVTGVGAVSLHRLREQLRTGTVRIQIDLAGTAAQ
jgi:preprotein translocase subunit SecD